MSSRLRTIVAAMLVMASSAAWACPGAMMKSADGSRGSSTTAGQRGG